MYKELKFSTGLKNKFPMPQSPKEIALAILLIGISVIIGSSLDSFFDLSLKINGKSAVAQYSSTIKPRTSSGTNKFALYIFSDDGSFYGVLSDKPLQKGEVATKQVEVAWQLGEPQNAQILWQNNNLWGVLVGLLISIIGILRLNHAKKDT